MATKYIRIAPNIYKVGEKDSFRVKICNGFNQLLCLTFKTLSEAQEYLDRKKHEIAEFKRINKSAKIKIPNPNRKNERVDKCIYRMYCRYYVQVYCKYAENRLLSFSTLDLAEAVEKRDEFLELRKQLYLKHGKTYGVKQTKERVKKESKKRERPKLLLPKPAKKIVRAKPKKQNTGRYQFTTARKNADKAVAQKNQTKQTLLDVEKYLIAQKQLQNLPSQKQPTTASEIIKNGRKNGLSRQNIIEQIRLSL